MRRRTATLVTTVVLLIGLVTAAWMIPVPFVAMSPGPTANVLGKVEGKSIIEIKGAKTYPTDGKLDLTTVAVTSPDQRLELVGALTGWLDPTVAVVPREYLYPGDPSPEQVEEENVAQMQGSQHTAVAAALRQLGQKVTEAVQVYAVEKGGAAVGKLKAGDVIESIDGKSPQTPKDVTKLVGARKPGESVAFVVKRANKNIRLSLKTTASKEEPKRPLVGVRVSAGYDLPTDAKINLGQDIGGPSAGLMFALAIVDRMTEGSLTGGRHIAGTGEIDAAGKVGPIGGIQQKVAGAKEGGATVFLTPADNCADALRGEHDDIRLVKVKNLKDAVSALEHIERGSGSVPSCGG